jgi:hypothetical protein
VTQWLDVRRWAIAAGLALTVASCGGTPSPEDYFGNVAQETEAYGQALDDLRDAYAADLRDELSSLADRTDFTNTAAVDAYFVQAKEVAIVKTADLLTNAGAELRTVLDALDELEPPEELVAEHQDAITSGEALAASMPSSIEALRNLASIEQLQETFETTAYSVAAQRFAIACENLEAAARSRGINVDFVCPGGIDRSTG